MNAGLFIFKEKLNDLNLEEKEKEKLIQIANYISVKPKGELSILHNFIDNVKLFPLTAQYKNISFENLLSSDNEQLESFIKGCNTNFKRILNVDNNKIKRQLHKTLDKGTLDKFCRLSEKMIDNANLMKRNAINFNDYFSSDMNNNEAEKAIESMDDLISKNRIIANGEKLMKSIISNKYVHLINYETKEIFKELAKQNVSREMLQKSVAPKLAAMNDSGEFNDLINNAMGLNSSWNRDFILEKIKDAEGEVLLEEGNNIFVDISTFKESSYLGSQMWCLVRDQSYLEEYLYEDNSRLIFKFDLSLDVKDENSYAAALYKTGILKSVFDKNDVEFVDTDDNSLFNSFKNIKFPKQSELTKNKKRDFYYHILNDEYSDFRTTETTKINIINLESIDLLKKMNKRYPENLSFSQFSANASMFESKESVMLAVNNTNYLKSAYDNINNDYLIILSGALQEDIDEKGIDDIFSCENVIKKVQFAANKLETNPKFSNVLENTEMFFNSGHLSKIKMVLNKFKEHGINPSDFSSAQSLKVIDDKMLDVFTEIEPDYISSCFKKNIKRAIISLFHNPLNESNLEKIQIQMPRDEKTIEFMERRLSVLSRKEPDS